MGTRTIIRPTARPTPARKPRLVARPVSRSILATRAHTRLVLGDDGDLRDLRWVHLFGEGPIHVRGQVWDMGAAETDPAENRWRFDDAVQSIVSELETFHPPLLTEHDHNGAGYGLMRRVRVLDREMAGKLGIRQTSPRACYGGFEITDPVTLADYDNGRIQYVSPEFRALFTDDAGTVHSLFVAEVSRVSSPVLKHQQTPVSELRGVALGEKAMKMSYDKAAMAAYCAEYGVTPEKVEDFLTGLLEQVQVMEAEAGAASAEEGAETEAIEELRRAQEAEEEAKKEAAEVKAEAATLSDRLKRLEGELRSERRARLAAAFRADYPHTTEVQRNAALSLADTDEKGARALLSDITRTTGRVSAAVASATGPRVVGDSTVAPASRSGASLSLSEEITKSPAKAREAFIALGDQSERGAFLDQYRKARGISLSVALSEIYSGQFAPRGSAKA